jgi:signal transduction histidine kinase
MSHSTIEELRGVPLLGDLPDETIQWIIDHTTVKYFDKDEIHSKTGDPVEHMWIILSGGWDFYWDTNGQLTYIRSWHPGFITGLLPYSRMKVSPGYTISTSSGKALLMHKSHFNEMERRFPELVKRLVELLTDRVREFTASHQQQEKMSALGRMSAGLAHELNNPAAAIQRISDEINIRLIREIDGVLALIDTNPDKQHIANVLLQLKEKGAKSLYRSASPIERAQLEDDLYARLNGTGFKDAAQIAESFAEIGVTVDELDDIIAGMSEHSPELALTWIENIVMSERLLTEIQKASGRISQLVNSIKSYVHMDRSYDMQPTDIHDGLDSTIVLLNHKIKQKNIHVVKNYFENVPQVEAFAGELNQVWTNIIDNALDAMDKGGTLSVTTSIERNMVKVSIVDTGHGIPKDIKDKIFDPFFTTKPVGSGVGLGLEMVKRIVLKHHGDIKVSSEPGKTEFIVCIPIPGKEGRQVASTGEAMQ